ncbi:MAG: exodeoxyribonuclease VII large subunit, partial [Hyphomicrobiales bacterium]|nr:exodeoxyribonuclease VII large subunit [Hyphomicrobiales bacterium]
VILWPVTVQGETAAAEVAAAIRGFNAPRLVGGVPRPDVIIVARGGGSLEDLWCFNEEVVVRAAADSTIPLIAAVGHETDITLIDHVADRRAPTPTAAAEIAVPVRSELLANLGSLATRHGSAAARFVETRRRELQATVRALPKPDDFLGIVRRRLDETGARLERGLLANARAHRLAFERNAGRLSVTRLRELLRHNAERTANLAARRDRAQATLAERRRLALSAGAKRLRPEPIGERIARDRERLGAASTTLRRAQQVFTVNRRQRIETLDT